MMGAFSAREVLAWAALGILTFCLLITWAALQLAAFFTCGVLYPGTTPVSGISALVSGPADTGRGCSPSTVTIAIITGVLVLVTGVLAIAGYIVWRNVTESAWYFRRDLMHRRGFAQPRELHKTVSPKAMVSLAATIRPTVQKPRAEDAGWRVGSSFGIGVYVSSESSMCIWGPPRSGKGYRIVIGAILDQPGAVITTSTRGDNLAATYAMRQKISSEYTTVFDPQGISGIAPTKKWSPIIGSQVAEVATRRANSILSADPSAKGNNAEWAKASARIAAGLLHAAALGNRTIEDLRMWTSSPGASRAALDVLRATGTHGWAERLEATLDDDPRLISSNWHSLRAAFDPLFLPRIAAAMSPAEGEEFDPREFIRQRGALYLIGTNAGVGAAGGFLSAMLSDIVEEARQMAFAARGGRLDPPLALILDEIANMFYWEDLPIVMADGGGSGISVIVVFQGLSQARSGWSPAQADTIWSSSNVKVLLGGASDFNDMKSFSELLGTRTVRKSSTNESESGVSTGRSTESVPLMRVDELRRLPDGLGVMSSKNTRPILLDMRGWTERADSKEIIKGKRATEEQQYRILSALYGKEPVEPTAAERVPADQEDADV